METVLVEKKNINEVVELLKQDEVVAFPTETANLPPTNSLFALSLSFDKYKENSSTCKIFFAS